MRADPAVELKGPRELAAIRRAGEIVAGVLRLVAGASLPGASAADLDRLAEAEVRRRGGVPAFLRYNGYPASLCVSVNEEVVHGLPGPGKVLREGDIVGLDLGCRAEGYFADAAVTVPVGRVSPEAADLVETAREALELAIARMRPGQRIGDISHAVQELAEARGYSVVRKFAGHGIGRGLHEAPSVPNYGSPGTGLRLAPGMVLALEPMVNRGGPDVRVLDDGWTEVTCDGELSAHMEHTVAVTEDGPLVLTA